MAQIIVDQCQCGVPGMCVSRKIGFPYFDKLKNLIIFIPPPEIRNQKRIFKARIAPDAWIRFFKCQGL